MLLTKVLMAIAFLNMFLQCIKDAQKHKSQKRHFMLTIDLLAAAGWLLIGAEIWVILSKVV